MANVRDVRSVRVLLSTTTFGDNKYLKYKKQSISNSWNIRTGDRRLIARVHSNYASGVSPKYTHQTLLYIDKYERIISLFYCYYIV